MFLSIVSTQITSAESSADAQVVTLEHQFESAMVIGDIAFLDSLLTEDFSFTHGDGWAKGGTPLRVDSKDTVWKQPLAVSTASEQLLVIFRWKYTAMRR